MRKEFEKVEIESRNSLREWFARNHGQTESIWLVIWKKGDPRYVAYNDIVEEALCFGWVDSLPRALDETRSMLLLSPRKPGSAWSKANKDRVERLIAYGLMMPPGLAKIEAAKANGLWDKLEKVDALDVPDDLAEALAAYPSARQNFDAFPPSVRRGILEWIIQAKRPETRQARIQETAEKAEANIRANQWRDRASKA